MASAEHFCSKRSILFITSFFCLLYIMWIAGCHLDKYFDTAPLKRLFIHSEDDIERNELIKKLQSVQQKLIQLRMKGVFEATPVLVEVQDIMNSSLFKNVLLTSNASNNNLPTETELDVCHEVYMGTTYGYSYYVTGWVMENCTNARSIEKVISVVLNPIIEEKPECSKVVESLINGIRKAYQKVKIIIPHYSVAFCSNKTIASVYKVTVDKKWTPGRKWNTLVRNITTPYIFIGRDLDNFIGWISRLERQVRVISFIPHVQVAGGSVRNRTGHWQVGCYQSDMRNYVLRYEDGYYASKNECMYCDYIIGPFVVKTELLKKLHFDENLPKIVLFEDFFLKVRQQSYLTMNCPDAMHFASDNTIFEKENNKLSWQPLVKKWELNRIVLQTGKVFGYNCKESGLKCSNVHGRTKFYLLPPCCLEQFSKAISVFHEFCLKNNIFYEFDTGSALGLVKMADYIPWDIDADFTFYNQNFTFIKSSENYFKKLGTRLATFKYKNKEKTIAYFRYYTPDLHVEFWGTFNLSKDVYEPHIFTNIPTKARLRDTWVYSPISPGLYARNRYGIEVLRHSQSWLHIGFKNSWYVYPTGKFKPCKNPNYHSCLEHFSTDGNLQFKIPPVAP